MTPLMEVQGPGQDDEVLSDSPPSDLPPVEISDNHLSLENDPPRRSGRATQPPT